MEKTLSLHLDWMHFGFRKVNACVRSLSALVDINVVISTHFTEVPRTADEVFTRAQLTEYLERVSVRTPNWSKNLFQG